MSEDRICVVFDELLDDNHVLLAGLKIERAFEEPFTFEATTLSLIVRAGFVYFGKQERLRDLDRRISTALPKPRGNGRCRRRPCSKCRLRRHLPRMQRDWETNQLMG